MAQAGMDHNQGENEVSPVCKKRLDKMNCPICQHPLYHESPPLVKLPPLRVYCDGCQGWLAWEPTGETQRVDEKAPLCPACKKPMALKNLRKGGLRFGCETWKACKTGMRPEGATVTIDVPVYRLVRLEVVESEETAASDEDAARFSRAWEERQGDYDKIREREAARERRFRFDRGVKV